MQAITSAAVMAITKWSISRRVVVPCATGGQRCVVSALASWPAARATDHGDVDRRRHENPHGCRRDVTDAGWPAVASALASWPAVRKCQADCTARSNSGVANGAWASAVGQLDSRGPSPGILPPKKIFSYYGA
jgi:hypothetical protein